MSCQTKMVLSRIKSDKRVQRLENAFNTLPYYDLQTEDLSDEIARLHKLRLVRSLRPSEREYVNKLVEASVQDQSTRSRLCEIRLTVTKAAKSLESALYSLKEYLLIEYSTDLAYIKTKGERENVVNTVLSKYSKYVASVNSISDQCLIIIEDIDKAAWSLKLQIDALQIANRPERQI